MAETFVALAQMAGGPARAGNAYVDVLLTRLGKPRLIRPRELDPVAQVMYANDFREFIENLRDRSEETARDLTDTILSQHSLPALDLAIRMVTVCRSQTVHRAMVGSIARAASQSAEYIAHLSNESETLIAEIERVDPRLVPTIQRHQLRQIARSATDIYQIEVAARRAVAGDMPVDEVLELIHGWAISARGDDLIVMFESIANQYARAHGLRYGEKVLTHVISHTLNGRFGTPAAESTGAVLSARIGAAETRVDTLKEVQKLMKSIQSKADQSKRQSEGRKSEKPEGGRQ